MLRRSLAVVALLAACDSAPASAPDADVPPTPPDGPSLPTPPPGPSRCGPPIGYIGGLLVDLADAPAEGRLRAEVVAGDESVVLEVEIDVEAGGGVSVRCVTPPHPGVTACVVPGPSFSVGFMATLVPERPYLLHIQNIGDGGGPAELTITVQAGAASGTATLRPVYETTEPWGPDCGDFILATEAITLTEAP